MERWLFLGDCSHLSKTTSRQALEGIFRDARNQVGEAEWRAFRLT